jgi:hypothetical protein
MGVRMLTEEGADFGETRDKVRKIRELLNTAAIGILRQARQVIEHVWPRLAARSPSTEIATSVEELTNLLGSDQIIDSWNEIAERTKTVHAAYKRAYTELFEARREAYETAIGEIKNRAEWAPLEATNPAVAGSTLSQLSGRLGSDEDKEAVASGTTLGKASLTEMESDLAAVDGLKSSVLVKLQELSIGDDKKAPVRRVRVSDFFNRPIQTQAEFDRALELIRDSLQKCIDEGAVIILE